MTYIPSGDDYTAGSLPEALAEADPGPAAKVEVSEASAVRQDALADLRANGDEAAALADTLTSEFPTDVAAVPYEVSLGSFEGEAAWIVFEAWGEADGTLGSRRVWVFSYSDRALLAAHSSR